ncbi:hypothetical protein ACFWPJ_15835, partial [Nocardia sp. NPDC058497]
MNEGAKVIRLDVNVEARQRPPARRWPDQPVQATPVTSLSERRPGMPTLPPRSLSDIVRDAVGAQIENAAEFARRRFTGDYQVDEFGYDEHLLESVILPALRPLSDFWFRVEVAGIENIPATGGALIVANHAGT